MYYKNKIFLEAFILSLSLIIYFFQLSNLVSLFLFLFPVSFKELYSWKWTLSKTTFQIKPMEMPAYPEQGRVHFSQDFRIQKRLLTKSMHYPVIPDMNIWKLESSSQKKDAAFPCQQTSTCAVPPFCFRFSVTHASSYYRHISRILNYDISPLRRCLSCPFVSQNPEYDDLLLGL